MPPDLPELEPQVPPDRLALELQVPQVPRVPRVRQDPRVRLALEPRVPPDRLVLELRV